MIADATLEHATAMWRRYEEPSEEPSGGFISGINTLTSEPDEPSAHNHSDPHSHSAPDVHRTAREAEMAQRAREIEANPHITERDRLELINRAQEEIVGSMQEGLSPQQFSTEYASTVTSPMEKKKPIKHKKLPLTTKRIDKKFKVIIKSLEKKEKEKLEKLDKSIVVKVQEIGNIKKDIRKKEKEFKAQEKQIATKKQISSIHEEFQLIQTHPKIKAVYSYGEDIVFETKELFVSDFYMDCKAKIKRKTKKPRLLGGFTIVLNISKTNIMMAVANRDFNSDGYDLPTIQQNRCCWGNIYEDIKNDLRDLKISEFINDMIGYLESPHNRSAFIRWKRYFADQEKRKLKRLPKADQRIITLGTNNDEMFYMSGGSNQVINYNDFQITQMDYGAATMSVGSTGYVQQQMGPRELTYALGESLLLTYSGLDQTISGALQELDPSGKVFLGMFLQTLYPEGSDYSPISIRGSRGRDGFDISIFLRSSPRMSTQSYSEGSMPSELNIMETEHRIFIHDSMVRDPYRFEQFLRLQR